jgi:hypothetical protein
MSDDRTFDRGRDARGSAAAPDDAAAEGRANRCLRCGATVQSLGVHEFRTGGSTGAAHLLFGQWAELGEDKLAFEILACSACRHVELRLPA